MFKIVPLISSGVAGPLGILHLPRLWLKGLLGAYGQLADCYADIGPGYDHMILEVLNIDPAQAKAFIRDKKPTYPEFEIWVKAYPGATLDATSIQKVNAIVTGYHHKDDVRKSILAANGLPDDGKILDAVNLNNLDDWKEFHDALAQS